MNAVALVNRDGCSIGDVGRVVETFRNGAAVVEFRHRVSTLTFPLVKRERLNRSEWTAYRKPYQGEL